MILTGVRPYYRRRWNHGEMVTVYFRLESGRTFRMCFDGDEHRVFKPGQSYTFEILP